MATATNRHPAVAGQFYPADPERLRADVRGYLLDAQVTPAPEAPAALIVPHAGLIYSGPTAAYAYGRVCGRRPQRIVLLGCSHRYPIETASLYAAGAFMSPLGDFPVDAAFAREFARRIDTESAEPHFHEHALEVQLPFLAEVFGATPLVPLLFGATIGAWHGKVAAVLAEMLEPADLVIASTDLSHYMSEAEANRMDWIGIDAICAGDWKAYAKGIQTQRFAQCGAAAVAVAMAYGQERNIRTTRLLDYRTSARASGDFARVVGYAAISMEYNEEVNE